tara:strand:- start:142 stop:327 length:186 start_codon:yes stop_codon:yes gene_type:complete
MSTDKNQIEEAPSARSKIPVTLWEEDSFLIDCKLTSEERLIQDTANTYCQLSLQTDMQFFE